VARPRTPTALKLIRGTAQPCRTNPREPRSLKGKPKPPEHLSERARTAWDSVTGLLADMNVLSKADGLALECLCESYAEMLWARERIRQYKSPTYRQVSRKETGEKDLDGKPVYEERIMIRAVPEVGIAADAERRFKSWLAVFGLTPADRSRVSAGGDKSVSDDPWSRL
jgi:P27 family predicted phage terminase small subunit